MACRTLLRRKSQLDVLASACEQNAVARVGLRRRAAVGGEARLVAIKRTGLRLAWMGDRLPDIELEGHQVEVRFECAGEHYVFAAVTRGCVGPEPGCVTDETAPLIELSLPLRLEIARRRRPVRLVLDDQPPIMGTFTHVIDDRRQFCAQLQNIGDGGLGIAAKTSEVSRLHTGDLFWVDMRLPGERTYSELIVRLVYLRPIKNSDQLAMGWAFQPTDDVANHERYLRRLAAFIARR